MDAMSRVHVEFASRGCEPLCWAESTMEWASGLVVSRERDLCEEVAEASSVMSVNRREGARRSVRTQPESGANRASWRAGS